MKKSSQKRPESTFKQAVSATTSIARCFNEGLQALGSNSKKVHLGNPRDCEGSVFIDKCLKSMRPDESRWDYAIGYRGKAYFLEVHPAKASEVDNILRKLAWLKEWLRAEAPKLEQMRAKEGLVWLASGKIHIIPGSREYKILAQRGLLLQRLLNLS